MLTTVIVLTSLAGILVFVPERHYADPEHTVRVYFDMHTGEWWWHTQVSNDIILHGIHPAVSPQLRVAHLYSFTERT